MAKWIYASENTASQRRVTFRVLNSSFDPLTTLAGEQPQISVNGSSWSSTGIGTLNHIGSGIYYAELTAAVTQSPGRTIQTRFKHASSLETPGETVQVVAFDSGDLVRFGLPLINLARTIH